MNFGRRSTLLITCFSGLAPWLEQELVTLGYTVETSHSTGVTVQANMNDAMHLCLCLRTALNVMFLVGEFEAETAEDLYSQTMTIPWDDMIDADGYVSVVVRVDTPAINNTMFAALKLKDAIVDRIASRKGRRPDSGPERNKTVVNLFWKQGKCWVYVNAAGQKLSDRGYRKQPGKAPLRETLAAGILAATPYDGSQPIVLPMCGSGTLAIEAALIGLNKAPGYLRTNFGFMHLIGFNNDGWQDLRKMELQEAKKSIGSQIIASDIDPNAVRAARQNARTAGVDHLIEFKPCDFENTDIPPGNGIILMNPEYGERLGNINELKKTYKRIGDFYKTNCHGYTAYVFSGSMPLLKSVGLKPQRRVTYFNGKIECRLAEYPIFEGSKHKRDW